MKHILFYLDRISRLLSEAAAVLAGLFILATAFIIVYEIIMRGIFHAPTEWVLEVSTYFIIMAGFLGLAITFRHDAHVRVDFLTGKLSPAHQRLINLITSFLSILLFLIFMTESMDLVTSSYTYGKLSPSILRFPLFIPQAALVIGSALLLLELLRRFLYDLLQLPASPSEPEKEA